MRSLRDIEVCFQGVIPSYFSTCDESGEPNLTCISIVHLLADDRVGVSCQFMNKTLRNLRTTGRAWVTVMNPQTLREFELELRFEELVESGPVFERMATTLAGVASQSHMEDVLELTGVAEFRVVSWTPTGPGVEIGDGTKESGGDPIARLDRISAAMATATDLEMLFDRTFEVLDHEMGLSHGFLLWIDGRDERLYTIASHGFGTSNFGAEIDVGEGIYGTVAARRTPIRTGSMSRERLMISAVARATEHVDATRLALPGLVDAESSIGIPVPRGESCLGVLCFQSRQSAAFTEGCERTLQIVARQLGSMVPLLGAPPREVEVSATRGPLGSRALVTRVKFFESDGSVFLDDDYLIKGVAGRVLLRVLTNYVAERRDEFSSKEIRLDPEIGLPDLKDNLEARLIALRKRLEERTSAIRIEKTGRGRFRVELSREVTIERRP